jgi:hypothetical protein
MTELPRLHDRKAVIACNYVKSPTSIKALVSALPRTVDNQLLTSSVVKTTTKNVFGVTKQLEGVKKDSRQKGMLRAAVSQQLNLPSIMTDLEPNLSSQTWAAACSS